MTTLANLLGQGGSGLQVWSATRTIKQWESVISPLDGEIYTRKTATGVSAIDPADDLINYIASSYVRTTSVGVPAILTAESVVAALTGATQANIPAAISSGVRTLVLEAVGRGALGFLSTRTSISTAIDVAVELEIDGRVVGSTIHRSTSTSGQSHSTFLGSAVPGLAPNGVAVNRFFAMPQSAWVQFRRSMRVYYTPNVALTAPVQAGVNYIMQGIQ